MGDGSKIQITTQVNLEDSQFKNKTREVLDFLKTMTKTKALLKLKFDSGDVRKELQSALNEAYRGLEKAYGVKAGQRLAYKGPKGALRSVNTKQQQERALEYFSGRMDDKTLSQAEQNHAKRIVEAHRVYNDLTRQIQDLDRRARRVFTQSLDDEESEGKRRAREHRELTRTHRRGYNIEAAHSDYDKAYYGLQYREQQNRVHRENDTLTAKQIGLEIQKNQELIAAKKALFRLEGRRKSYTDQEVQQAKSRIEALRREKEEVIKNAKAKKDAEREQQNYNKAVFQADVARRRASQTAAKQAERAAIAQENAQNRVVRQYQQQYGILGGLGRRLSSYLSIYAMANFGRKVAETTGYFEKQQVALEGILGSASKAQSVLSQIKDFALHSPFQTKELVTFTKQLAAFSIPADELFETTKRLADISAGLGVDMSRIILAYGQVRSAAVLRGQELRQFTEAGIPLVQKLAEKFTQLRGEVVTTADVFELISKRQVSFKMVSDVLSDMTKEGGQFYKMQENITETLYGQMQKLQDLWTIKMDEMGKGTGSFLMNVVKLLQLIVKNANGVAAALLSAFALNHVIRSLRVTRLEWELLNAEVKRSIGSIQNFRKLRLVEFGKNMAWGVAAAGVGIAVGAIYQWYRKLGEVQRKMDEITDSFNKETNKMVGGFDNLVQRLRSAKAGTQAYNDAIETLKTNYGEFLNVNDKTIAVLLSEQKAVDGTVTEYQKLREEIAAAIKLKQQYNELKTQKETLAGLLGDKSSGTDFWGTGYKGINNSYADMVRNILAGLYGPAASKEEWNRRINELFGTNFNGDAVGELRKEFNDIAKQTIEQFTSSVNIPEGLLDDDAKKAYLQAEFEIMYGRNFSNKFLSNTLSSQENDFLKNFESSLANKIFAGMSNSGNTWKEFLKASEKMAGNGTDLLSAMIRINNIFDKYTPGENAGVGAVGKQEWTNQKYISLLGEAAKEFDALGGDKDKLKALTDLLGKEYGPSSVSDITNALNEFFKTIEDASRREVVSNAAKRFKDGTDVLTRQEEKIVSRMGNDATWAGINRGKIKDVDLQNFIDTYNPAALGEQTVQQTRDKIRSAYDDLRKELKTYTKDAVNFADDIALTKAKMSILERLAKGDLYAVDLTEKNKGGSGGGWRRMFGDLFNYIKEARAEEKKLVEFSAGTTKALEEQIKSGQLEGTPVAEFWGEGSPFKKLIDKIGEYGLESEVFSESFLRDELGKVITRSIKSTGTIDYMDVWNQLIKIMSDRADQLGGAAGKAIKEFLQGKIVEGEKLSGGNQVENLIREQLQELRKINGQFENIRSTQNAINSIRGASNAYRAYGALGSRGYTSSAEVTRQQLSALLGAKGGKGLSLATPLAQLINGGSLGINSISQILAIKESLAGITAKDMQGDDEAARQAKFEDFKGVLGQFDQLLGQLTTDLLDDFNRLMASKDPAMRATDDIINAYDEYSKSIALIAHGLANGDIAKEQKGAMMTQAVQNLYTAVAKSMGGDGMPEYINRLFQEFGTTTGTSKRGFELGMWLGGGSLSSRVANYEAAKAGINRSDFETEEGEFLEGEFLEAVEKAAGGVLKFASKMELASAIVQKVDSYIQKSAQFANKLIDALDANNGLTKDEYGNYTYENDYSTAKEAINMISEFSSGISGAFQSLMSGDIFGAITGIGSTIAGFFENIFGIGDSQVQKQQDKIISSNKSLERAMTNLQHALEDAAGKDKWDNLTEQIENLREQEKNNKQLENLEVSKKHGDADKAESYRSASEEAAREAENMIRQIREEVLGVADDIASQLTDAFAEAFRNGENMARAWRDSVRSIISDMLKQTLLTNVVAPKINDIFKKFGIEEGKTDADSIIAIMSDPSKMTMLRNSLFAEGTWLQDWLKSLPQGIQEMIGWNNSTSELSGGIQGITEDTARTLEGLSNSILAQHVITNRYLSDMAVSGFAQVQLSWFNDMLNQQRAIRAAADSINSILGNSRDGIRSLQVRIE